MFTDDDRAFAEPAIEILRKRWPAVWQELSQVEPLADLEVFDAGNHPSFSHAGIQLASNYDPDAEARLQISTIDHDADTAWLYGVGIGYLPRQLLSDRDNLKRLHVVILNKSLFVTMLYCVDQSDWLVDERIELSLPDILTIPHHPYAITTPCLWLADQAALAIRDRLMSELNTEFTQSDWGWNAKRYTRQIAENEGFLGSDGDVRELFGTRENGTVIVAAAGPTLGSSMEIIREKVAAGAALIAVDAALRPLLAQNILPDVVVTIDPNKGGVLPNFTGDLGSLKDAVLVYFPVVHHDVIATWPYRRLAAYPADDALYEKVVREFPKSHLFVCGSVLHPAVDLGVKMGARTIYLAGADFSFPHGKTHAAEVPHGKALAAPDSGVDSMMVKNGRDEMVPSQLNMIGYLRDLEYYIASHRGTKFINVSRDGAFILGTEYE